MIRQLQWKPDFAKTVDRFAAWARGDIIDRPPVTCWVKGRDYTPRLSAPSSMRERWMNVQHVVDSAVESMSHQIYVGDSFPIFWANIGPEITATLLGCELDFSANSSWSRPIVETAEDWAKIATRPANFANPYWQAMEQMTQYALDVCGGRYIVGLTDLHGAYDILAALRDPQMLCMDLLDTPELVGPAGIQAAKVLVESFERQSAMLAKAGMGYTCWTPLYFDEPYYVPSCDFWCMVSSELTKDLILPTVVAEIAPLKRSIFHLDGPQALRYLDLLLEMPNLDAVQWVFGDGHGPAARWIDVYKRIRAAGKSVQVMAESPADALTVLHEIGPKGVWITGCSFQSASEAEQFLRDVEKLTRTPGAKR